MIKKIVTTRQFDKQFRTLPSSVQKAFAKRLTLFLENPQNPLLRVHVLRGNFSGIKSFNVTGDIRVLFDESQSDVVILLVAIGTHSELYG